VTIDVGTGDGRAVLATAATEPAGLAIGIDANAASMAEVSRRAARSPAKGGQPNALFLLGAAEAIPEELHGIADLVTVQLPWGSLLRGCLGQDDAVAAGVASLLRPGGTLELLLAPAERDRLDGFPTELAGVAAAASNAFATYGLSVIEARPATAAEILASHSTWARRLLAGPARKRRTVTLVRMRSSAS